MCRFLLFLLLMSKAFYTFTVKLAVEKRADVDDSAHARATLVSGISDWLDGLGANAVTHRDIQLKSVVLETFEMELETIELEE